ncbi:MAG: catalase family protein [Candidatus Electrothrix sp. YB6]
MNPELRPDFSLQGEDEIFQQMIKLTVKMMEESKDGCPLRVQHAKATACVTASFEIEQDIPDDLRYGIFTQPGRTFDAIVRFSNAQGSIEPDGEATGRGLAIKLPEVDGSRALEGDTDRSQDFLFVNHPVFPFPTPKEYLEIIERKNIPLVGDLLTLAHLFFDRDQLEIIKKIRAKSIASPLSSPYWSGAPFWLGDAAGTTGQAVKYSAIPAAHTPGPADPEKMSADYLREAVAEHLAQQEAIFDFMVQQQGDPVKMPIEDASVYWDEQKSVPVKVATLRIAMQPVEKGSELKKRCEAMSFTPWHAQKEHRPLGGINRLRKAVYSASFTERERRKKAV